MEKVAVIFTLLSVYLTTRSNNMCWPVGILGILGFMSIFYQIQDWGNFGLQFIFLYQSVKGWLNWADNKLTIRNWNRTEIINLSSIPIIFISIFSVIYLLTNTINYLDVITTTISIFALYLLTKKVIQTWFFWASTNILYIILFYNQQLYYSSILYFILLVLAISGYITWKKELKN